MSFSRKARMPILCKTFTWPNSYDVDEELRLDLSNMHPEVVKFMMAMMEDVGDWYSGLTDEIEAAYGFFLDTAL